MTFYHTGALLFDKFKISIESEITYSDYCKHNIYVHKYGVKFTDKALLMLYPSKEQDDWIESKSIDFCPWDNIIGIQNIRGHEILEEFSSSEIKRWLSTITTTRVHYPFLHAERGHVVYIVQGVPKSERSKKGKKRLKQDVRKRIDFIQKHFGSPAKGPVEMLIEVFSTDPNQLPDVDRMSITIMDAFEGTVYETDKQVRQLNPRVFSSTSACKKLQCQTEPMEHYEIENIPAGSLYPLSTGVLDYYVIRIITYRS